jgi:anti-sigma B factor antagonist
LSSSADDLAIEAEAVDERTTLVTVAGEVTFTNAQRLAQALEVGTPRLVVDLTEVGFIDSSGLAALLAARRRGGEVALVHGPEPPSILRFRGVERLLALYRSRAEALAA